MRLNRTVLLTHNNFPRILCGDTRKKRITDTTSGDGKETIKNTVEMEEEKETEIKFFEKGGVGV